MERGQLMRTMLGAPPATPPTNEGDVVSALTADQIRACLYWGVRESESGRVHSARMKRWVISKLQGISHHSADDVEEDFNRVLSGDYGANLDAIGDVIWLKGGFYYPAPPTAVMTGDRTASLVSGYPTLHFTEILGSIHLGPVGRTIVGLDRDQLARVGIRPISVDEYLGPGSKVVSPDEFLLRFASESGASANPIGPGWFPYRGEHGEERGYNFGPPGRAARAGPLTLALWRGPDWQGYYLENFSSTSRSFVSVQSGEWRRIALAIDAVTGHAREARISTDGENGILEVEFGLPPAVYRFLYASGGAWRAIHAGAARYSFPEHAREGLKQMLERYWVQVRSS